MNFDVNIDLSGAYRGLEKISSEFDKARRKLERPIDIKTSGDPVAKLAGEFNKTAAAASKLERETKQAMEALINAGKQGTAEYNKLEAELKQATAATKQLDAAMEKVEADVHGVEKAGGGLKGLFSQGLLMGGGIGLAMAGIQKVKEGIREMIDLGNEYEDSMADFSAITSVSGEELENFGDMAKDLANQFGGKTVDQIQTFKMLLSRLGLDLKNSPEAVEAMTKSVNTLAKAAGLTADEAMASLSETMLQFNVDMTHPIEAAKTMEKQMNTLAAASQVGASEVPQVAEAMKIAGATAHNIGISFEETTAAIEVLAKAGLQGAEAGTKLRGVFVNLAKVTPQSRKLMAQYGISVSEVQKTLGEKGLGAAMDVFKSGLESIQDPVKRATLLAQVFGKQNQAAAAALMTHSKTFKEYQKAITDTNIGTEQAKTKMETFSEVMGRLKTRIQNVAISVYEKLAPMMTGLANIFGDMLEPIFKSIGDLFNDINESVQPLIEAFQELFEGMGEGVSIGKVLGDVLGFLYKVTMIPLKNAIKSVATVLTWLVKLVKLAVDAFNWFNKSIKWVIKNTGILGDAVGFVYGIFKKLISGIGETITKVLQFFGILDKKQYKAPINKEATNEVSKSIEGLADNLEDASDNTEDLNTNLDQTAKKSETLEEKLKKVKKELVELTLANKTDTEEYNNKIQLARKLQKQIDELKSAQQDVNRAISASFREFGLSNINVDGIARETTKEFKNILENEPIEIEPKVITVDLWSGLKVNWDFSELFKKQTKDSQEAQEKQREEYKTTVKLAKAALNAQEISYEEYRRRVTKQQEETADVVINEWERVNKTLEGIFKQISDNYEQIFEKQAKILNDSTATTEEKADAQAAAWEAMGASVAASTLQAAISGENVIKSLAQNLIQMLPKIIAVYSAEIFGAFASLGPWAIPAGLAAIGALVGLAEIAYGAEEGYSPFENKGYGKKGASDTQLVWVNPQEAILTAQQTKENRRFIEHVRAGGNINNYNDLSVSELKGIRKELKKAKLVESYYNNKVIIEDNRRVRVKTLDWNGR